MGFFVIFLTGAAGFASAWIFRNNLWRKQISQLFHHIGAKNLQDVANALVQKAKIEARLQQELQDARHLLETTIHESPIGVILIDAEGKIQMMNETAIHLLGPKVAPVGRYQWEVVRSASLASLIENVRRGDRSAHQTFTAADGVKADYVRATIVPISQPPLGTLVFLEDVKPEEEWRRRKEDMIQILSHELKTPVSVISGYMELLYDAVPEEEIRREVMIPLQQAVESLKNLIADVLTLYRLESTPQVQFERVAFGALAESVDQVLAPIARQRNVSLHWDIPRPEPILFGSPSDLNLMLLNLVQNGIIYNRPGGSVFVSARKEGSHLMIEVRDTGIGISPHDIPRIFERFYRAEKGRSRENGGTGLGLAIVKHVAERHNGKVTVESRVGEGSVFRVYLPLSILDRESETANP